MVLKIQVVKVEPMKNLFDLLSKLTTETKVQSLQACRVALKRAALLSGTPNVRSAEGVPLISK